MHTSYGGDAIDEYAETIVRKPDGLYYRYGAALRKLQVSQITIAFKQGTRTGYRKFIVYHSHHGPIVRTEDDRRSVAGGNASRLLAIKYLHHPVPAPPQPHLRP